MNSGHPSEGLPTGNSGRAVGNLRPWQPGQSGNLAGRPKRLQACRLAIDEARDPEKVKVLLSALHEAALAGDIQAAKIWLSYVVPPMDVYDLELSDAPDSVLDYLADKLGRR